MNTTQRKYACQQIINIATAKILALREENTQLQNHITASEQIKVSDWLTHPPMMLEQSKMNLDHQVCLTSLFDMSDLKSRAKARQMALKKTHGAMSQHKTVNFVHPITGKSMGNVSSWYQSIISKAESLQAATNKAINTLLLGDAGDALTAIANFEAEVLSE